MKKVLLSSFVIGSIFANAQKLEGTIKFKDGSSKIGFITSVSEITKKNTIDYKADKKSKKETLSLDNASVIIYNTEDGQVEAYPMPYHSEINKKDSFYWAYKVKGTEKLNVFVHTNNIPTQHLKNGVNLGYSLSYYYFQHKKEPIQYVGMYTKESSPFAIKIGRKVESKIVLEYFEKKCPKLVEAYNNKEIKIKDDPFPFVIYFEEHCK